MNKIVVMAALTIGVVVSTAETSWPQGVSTMIPHPDGIFCTAYIEPKKVILASQVFDGNRFDKDKYKAHFYAQLSNDPTWSGQIDAAKVDCQSGSDQKDAQHILSLEITGLLASGIKSQQVEYR